MAGGGRRLVNMVALVTGASRGIGRGVAVQLGEAGATVYVTGRRAAQRETYLADKLQLQTVDRTAQEVTERGGKGIAVYCDHSDMTDVKRLFEQINKEQNGRLDILVNNAYAAVATINRNSANRFWEIDPAIWDEVNVVGLKNHYYCSVYASKMMVKRKQGLIVTVSSPAGCRYLFNTAYATGKAACDKLAADMAQELYSHNVASVGLWPGAVKTEIIQKTLLDQKDAVMNKTGKMAEAGKRAIEIFQDGESVEFSGKCVVALAADPRIMDKSGNVLETSSLAGEYNLTDLDGSVPKSLGDSMNAKEFLKIVNAIRRPQKSMI